MDKRPASEGRPCGGCDKEGCRVCFLFHTDERYARLWGGEVGPSLFKKAWGFAKAVFNHVRKGLPVVPASVQEERLAVCGGCEFFKKESSSCSRCGCFLTVKTSWAEQECPEGKWGRYLESVDRAEREGE